MFDFLTKLLESPWWLIFMLFGIIIFITSLVGRIGKYIDLGTRERIIAAIFGLLLLISGGIGGLVSNSVIPIHPGGINTSSTAKNSSDTPTSTSAPLLKELTVNRQLVCISDCNSAVIQITVVSFSFDTARKQTSMQLKLEAQQNYDTCYFTGLTQTLYFQDEAGNTYEPSGPVKEEEPFSLAKGSPLDLTATYSFLPSSDSTFKLLSSHRSIVVAMMLYMEPLNSSSE
jgi:hypothetical protein